MYVCTSGHLLGQYGTQDWSRFLQPLPPPCRHPHPSSGAHRWSVATRLRLVRSARPRVPHPQLAVVLPSGFLHGLAHPLGLLHLLDYFLFPHPLPTHQYLLLLLRHVFLLRSYKTGKLNLS